MVSSGISIAGPGLFVDSEDFITAWSGRCPLTSQAELANLNRLRILLNCSPLPSAQTLTSQLFVALRLQLFACLLGCLFPPNEPLWGSLYPSLYLKFINFFYYHLPANGLAKLQTPLDMVIFWNQVLQQRHQDLFKPQCLRWYTACTCRGPEFSS